MCGDVWCVGRAVGMVGLAGTETDMLITDAPTYLFSTFSTCAVAQSSATRICTKSLVCKELSLVSLDLESKSAESVDADGL